MDGGLIAVAAQVHDACACTRTRADRAAVGRQGADAGLFVDGHQIGDDEGAVELFLAAVQLLGVLDEGHRAGDALIAAAGVDDDRQLTAVHAGIRTGGCLGLGPDRHIVAVG